MSRKRIVVFTMLAIFAVMVGLGMHEALETPDATPFFFDPDFILVALGSLLTICLGRVLLALQRILLTVLVAFVRAFRFRASSLSYGPARPTASLLLSSPRRLLPLRI